MPLVLPRSFCYNYARTVCTRRFLLPLLRAWEQGYRLCVKCIQREAVPIMLKIMYLEPHEFMVDMGNQLAAQAVVWPWGCSQAVLMQ